MSVSQPAAYWLLSSGSQSMAWFLVPCILCVSRAGTEWKGNVKTIIFFPVLRISEIFLGDAIYSGIFLYYYKCNSVGSKRLHMFMGFRCICQLWKASEMQRNFCTLLVLFCFFVTSAVCMTKVTCHTINSEDLHYGVFPCFPSVLWSARELVPFITFIISREDCPHWNLSEWSGASILPWVAYLFETFLPLQHVVWLLEGDYRYVGYT